MSKLPPVLYHYFQTPLPYTRTLALQEKLHHLQLTARRTTSTHNDLLLLLQHRPVYTAGRRQNTHELDDERTRLTALGADFVTTARGGQLTYHGPGQLVGYPLLDLGRTSPAMGIREYVCRMQRTIQIYLAHAHGIKHVPSDHTGVFLDPQTKIASIGVQVRHRLTTHGFAVNVSREPLAWFERVVACGLEDVKAGCVEEAVGKGVDVRDVVQDVVDAFGEVYERDMEVLDVDSAGEVGEAIRELEQEALQAGSWLKTPLS